MRIAGFGIITVLFVLGGCSSLDPRVGDAAPIIDRRSESPASTPAAPVDEPVVQAYVPPETTVEESPASSERLAYVEPAPAPRPSSQAVQTLTATAEQQASSGDLAGAVSTIERALRIEPQNARLWNKLAHLRLKQGQYKPAAEMASRSNSFAAGDSALMRDNWLVISLARRADGDTSGAEEAMSNVRALN